MNWKINCEVLGFQRGVAGVSVLLGEEGESPRSRVKMYENNPCLCHWDRRHIILGSIKFLWRSQKYVNFIYTYVVK